MAAVGGATAGAGGRLSGDHGRARQRGSADDAGRQTSLFDIRDNNPVSTEAGEVHGTAITRIVWPLSMPATPLGQQSAWGAGPDQRRLAGIDASDAAGVAHATGAATAIPCRCEMFECAHI